MEVMLGAKRKLQKKRKERRSEKSDGKHHWMGKMENLILRTIEGQRKIRLEELLEEQVEKQIGIHKGRREGGVCCVCCVLCSSCDIE